MKLADEIFRRTDWRKTSDFGMRKDPFTGQPADHRGTDYGTGGAAWPQHALEDGVVLAAGASGDTRGNYVAVSYPRLGVKLLHYHLDAVKVKKGQAVVKGTVLGTTGTTGRSTGVHAHIGVQRADGSYLNPHEYDYQPPVREALPLESAKSAGKPACPAKVKPATAQQKACTGTPRPAAPKPPAGPFGVGDKVRIKRTGIPYFPGIVNIPARVGELMHTVDSEPQGKGGKRCVRLREINTWCDVDNLEKVQG